MTTTLARIDYFPVKGLPAQPLERVALSPGQGLPDDRRYAITHGASGFDPQAPAWLFKTHFVMLQRDENLAKLGAQFDPTTQHLTLLRAGRPVARGRIDTPLGRTLIEQFLAAFLTGPGTAVRAPGPYKVVEAPGRMFSDIEEKAVSLINAASCRDLERVTRAPVDPRRFRGNLLLEGLPAWAEASWVGRRLRIGATELEVFKTIRRCAATEVNPDTGERDLPVIKALHGGYGHTDCGIYARVLTGGMIATGDGVELL